MLWTNHLYTYVTFGQLHDACQLCVKEQLIIVLLLSAAILCTVDGFFSIRSETLVRGRFVITRLCHELAFVQWHSVFACGFESGQSRDTLNTASATKSCTRDTTHHSPRLARFAFIGSSNALPAHFVRSCFDSSQELPQDIIAVA